MSYMWLNVESEIHGEVCMITEPPSFKWQCRVYLHENFRQYSRGNAESARLKIIRRLIKYSLPTILCWAISKTDACKIDALDQWCLLMLLGIKSYQFVRNDDVWRLTKQSKLTAIIQSCRLTLFGHIMRMDDNADAKRILLAAPPADWRRQLGRPRITWLSTIQQDLKHHHLTLPEAADLAQNRPLWRMMSTYGAMQSWVAHQKRRRRRQQHFKETLAEVLLDHYSSTPYHYAMPKVGHLPPVKCSRHLSLVKRPLPVTCPLG